MGRGFELRGPLWLRRRVRAEGQRGRGAEGQRGRGAEGQGEWQGQGAKLPNGWRAQGTRDKREGRWGVLSLEAPGSALELVDLTVCHRLPLGTVEDGDVAETGNASRGADAGRGAGEDGSGGGGGGGSGSGSGSGTETGAGIDIGAGGGDGSRGGWGWGWGWGCGCGCGRGYGYGYGYGCGYGCGARAGIGIGAEAEAGMGGTLLQLQLQLQPISSLWIAVLLATRGGEGLVVAETGLFSLASLLGVSAHLCLAVGTRLEIRWGRRISGGRISKAKAKAKCGTIGGWGHGRGWDGRCWHGQMDLDGWMGSRSSSLRGLLVSSFLLAWAGGMGWWDGLVGWAGGMGWWDGLAWTFCC